ncbi:MAG TPA: thioredoxin family protein [Bryobacteraceae bacterium]|nr:thioredoxin family protein [Bryobacteraceae bacterium]
MPAATTVITPARFDQGLTYGDFLAQSVVNVDKFQENYKSAPLSQEDLAFFKRAASMPRGPANILAIAEAWCGDVYRELPTVARIADACGMRLRVFLRDQNPDIMDEFLSNDGKSRAIPVFVFYTSDMQYITHFTERSEGAHRELAEILDQIKTKMGLPQETTFATAPEDKRQDLLRELIARIQPRSDDWRKEAIKEMRFLLSSALHLPDRAL